LRKKGSKKKQSYQVDEHNMPTEPLPTIPTLLFPTPDPEQPPHAYPYIQVPTSGMDRYSSYPVLPGTPARASYGGWPTNAAWHSVNTKKQITRRRRFLPACVGLFFLCVQLLLIVRLGVRFLDLSPDITWAAVVTDVSEIFVLPFWLLWREIPLASTLLPVNMEVYTLVAILAYSVLSRLLVGILKVILKSR
jgi:hypothetical protein